MSTSLVASTSAALQARRVVDLHDAAGRLGATVSQLSAELRTTQRRADDAAAAFGRERERVGLAVPGAGAAGAGKLGAVAAAAGAASAAAAVDAEARAAAAIARAAQLESELAARDAELATLAAFGEERATLLAALDDARAAAAAATARADEAVVASERRVMTARREAGAALAFRVDEARRSILDSAAGMLDGAAAALSVENARLARLLAAAVKEGAALAASFDAQAAVLARARREAAFATAQSRAAFARAHDWALLAAAAVQAAAPAGATRGNGGLSTTTSGGASAAGAAADGADNERHPPPVAVALAVLVLELEQQRADAVRALDCTAAALSHAAADAWAARTVAAESESLVAAVPTLLAYTQRYASELREGGGDGGGGGAAGPLANLRRKLQRYVAEGGGDGNRSAAAAAAENGRASASVGTGVDGDVDAVLQAAMRMRAEPHGRDLNTDDDGGSDNKVDATIAPPLPAFGSGPYNAYLHIKPHVGSSTQRPATAGPTVVRPGSGAARSTVQSGRGASSIAPGDDGPLASPPPSSATPGRPIRVAAGQLPRPLSGGVTFVVAPPSVHACAAPEPGSTRRGHASRTPSESSACVPECSSDDDTGDGSRHVRATAPQLAAAPHPCPGVRVRPSTAAARSSTQPKRPASAAARTVRAAMRPSSSLPRSDSRVAGNAALPLPAVLRRRFDDALGGLVASLTAGISLS